MAAAHPRVLGQLGRALSLELSAVQQYMTHASLAEFWGDAEAAQRFRQETVEEMQVALDAYLTTYNTERSHQGRGMNGRTPYRAFRDRIPANDNTQEDNDRNIDQTEAA